MTPDKKFTLTEDLFELYDIALEDDEDWEEASPQEHLKKELSRGIILFPAGIYLSKKQDSFEIIASGKNFPSEEQRNQAMHTSLMRIFRSLIEPNYLMGIMKTDMEDTDFVC